MGKVNRTTNAGKNPFDRIDLWANGYWDFLLTKNYGDVYRNNIVKWKAEADEKHSRHKKECDLHYPNERKTG